jgi:hypothetical protein
MSKSSWPGNRSPSTPKNSYTDSDETKDLSAREIYELKERKMKGILSSNYYQHYQLIIYSIKEIFN